jgi:hydrophobe/amphiphile efflux-1 (HAE1) family protein
MRLRRPRRIDFMAVNVSAWAIRKPIPSIVLFLVLMILGLVSFGRLPITRFPNVDIPLTQVTVTQSGAAPAELETQVTKRIEDAIAGISGVKHIISTITDGRSVTVTEFRLEVDTDRAINDVKDAIARIRADLPRTIDEPIVERIDATGLPIVTYAARASAMTAEELSWYVDDVAARALQSARGVAQIERIGGVSREIRVALDPDRMLALGVTAGEVSNAVRASNVDLAGGKGDLGPVEQSIRTLGGAKKLEDLAGLTIAVSGGRTLRLDEVATITDGFAEPTTFARFDGEPIVAFSIYRSKGASDATVAQEVAAKVDALNAARPDVKLELIDTYVAYTVGNYENAMTTLIEGALLAVVVVLIFLRDLRATIVTALALPLSILPAFWVMDMLGFSLNLVSLLAITLVTGILVDDAIVEIENIVRHRQMGKSPYRAALEAADEIGLAVIAITFTIVAVFAPVSFMSGIAGQYFKQFGLTVAVAVLFSLLVARLITPMLAAYFMRSKPHADPKDGWLMRFYTWLVDASVRWRPLTLLIGIGILVASMASTSLLPSGFLPAEDTARMVLAVEAPPGTRLKETARVVDQLTAQLKELPEIKSVYVDGGRVLGSGQEVRKATIVVNLTPKKDRTRTQKQMEGVISAIVAAQPDVRFWFLNENGQRGLSLLVMGSDQKLVERAAKDLAAEMRTLPLVANVVSTAALDRPELQVVPDTDRAARLGIATDTLSESIRVATIGDVSANLAKFNSGDRQIPIRVQLPESARSDYSLLETLTVRSSSGLQVPLTAVADIRLGQGPTAINRYDRARKVAVEADLWGTEALGEAIEAIYALPAAKSLPEGVKLVQSGDAEIMDEVNRGFMMAMGAGLMMVYGVLVLLFGSFLQPLTILFSLVFSIGGVIIALLITHNPISMPVVIGILMLLGIVAKNGIMLVDFAVEEIARGVDRRKAIVDAGRKRARPIIMTTIAMAAGMVPSSLALGDGGEFRAPMAIAVIGGLIAGTALSLVFVPAVFVLVDDVARGLWWIFGRFVGPTDEPGDEKSPAAPHPQPVLRAAE